MKRVAVTGVSGYVGNLILRWLEGQDYVERIYGIDLKPPQDAPSKLDFYTRDILQPLGDIFIENKIDTAIHLAFVLRPTHRRTKARDVDVSGASNFLSACDKAEVKQIMYLSSHTVYGAHPDNPPLLTEDSPLRPMHDFQYSWDKAESERMLGEFASSHLDVCINILRSCPVIGPNAANSIATAMFSPVMIRLAGYDPRIQFVHEDDVIELVAMLLERRQGGIFNVAGGGEMRYSEVARLLHKRTLVVPGGLLRFLLGLLWALRLQKESPPSGLEFIKYPPNVSTRKLKDELGFEFKHSSQEALISYINAKR
ncbi:NAD-dependent epimerase/dehydratase family protein [Chloroflexota bacterium]